MTKVLERNLYFKQLLPLWLTLFVFLLVACDQGLPFTPETEVVKGNTASPSPRPSYTETLRSPTHTHTPTGTPEPVSQLGVGPDDLNGVVIRFWHAWSGEAGDVIQGLVDEFNTSNEWGIVVEPLRQNTLDGMFANVNAAIEAGEPPDLVIGYLYQALAWDATHQLVDLSVYVDDPVWGFSQEEQADFYTVFWDHDISGDRRLGIPAQRSGQVLYYNTTWAQALGFQAPPVLPAQFKEQACAAARANREDGVPENDGTGGWIISTNYAAVLGWVYAFGGEILMPESAPNQTVYQFDIPQVEEAFTFLRDLYDSGCAWLAENQYPEPEFANRQGLFATGGLVDIPYQVEAFKQAGNGDLWTVIPFPSPDLDPALDVYGPSFEVLTSSPVRHLASWLFIKWLVEPQNQARLVEATGAFPLRESALDYLDDYGNRHPQWKAALQALPLAHSEPPFQSWSTVRWALSDATTQLFRYYFTIDQVPGLVEFLDQTASELHMGPEMSGIFNTPTNTPSPTFTPTITPTPTATFTITPTWTPSPTATQTSTSPSVVPSVTNTP